MTLTQINKAGLDEIALDHVFTIGASGSSAYTFQGEGLNGTVNNPTLYLTRGKTYRFENGSGGHPIRIQSTSGASGTAYNTGVTNNAGSGTVIVEVQHDAPDVLYYQCTSHAAMNGILYITGALADGGVTTAKIANSAVTNGKLAADAVTTAKIADDAVTTAKIADDAVTVDKIQNFGQNQIAGRTASGAGSLQGLSASDVRTMINVADGATNSPTTTINTNANNRIITGSDTANTLNGESSLTYDSGGMAITGNSDRDGLKITQSGNNYGELMFNSNRSSANGALGIIRGEWNNTEVASIYLTAGDDTTNKDDGKIRFYTAPSSGSSIQTRMVIDQNGKVGIGTQNPTEILHIKEGTNKNVHFTGGIGQIGNVTGLFAVNDANDAIVDIGICGSTVRIGTIAGERARFTGDGLCFNGDTAATNALDDYEEGTFTPTLSYSGTTTNPTYTTQAGQYTKIGNVVIFQLRVNISNKGVGSGNVRVGGLPFGASTETIGNQMVTASPVVGMDLGGDREVFVQFEGSNSSTLYFYKFGIESSVDYETLGSSAIDNDMQLNVRGIYFTAS